MMNQLVNSKDKIKTQVILLGIGRCWNSARIELET
jgi:hypothetical protein